MLEYLLNTSTNIFCQYYPRREGLRRGAVLRSICQASWPSPTTTLDRKGTSARKRHVWWVEGFALCFRSVHGWMGMHVWVNVFTMPFLRADSGPGRKIRAWPPVSAITTSSGSKCLSHQSQPGELLKPGRKRLLWRLLERALLPGDVGIFVKHFYKCFLSVLS